jgi:sugar lactone lactonase YvrE
MRRLLVLLLIAGCTRPAADPEAASSHLEEVARSDRQWTGIAVSKTGRIFVNYPRWSDDVTFSVGELDEEGEARPFPDRFWNAWDEDRAPADHFVCVQALLVDEADHLWILDPANPKFEGVVPGGPKLVRIDLATNQIVDTILFDAHAAPRGSYLNDLRIDPETRVAYLTDSGLGALIVLDLETNQARRVLESHPSTKSEEIVLTIDGAEWRLPEGGEPRVHADGIALSLDGRHLFWQALTGRTLYWIPTRFLRDARLTDQELGPRVRTAARSGAADGLLFGSDGFIYISSLEEGAIKSLGPRRGVQLVSDDSRIVWPDSFAEGPDGWIYFTTARIHEGAKPKGPYRILRFKP